MGDEFNISGDRDWRPEYAMTYEYVGGAFDGMEFHYVIDDDDSYWVTDVYPNQKFKHVFVPLDMKGPSIIG